MLPDISLKVEILLNSIKVQVFFEKSIDILTL